MNQYLFLRRMRGPIILLIFGVTAILDEYTGIGYSRSWPLYLIALGVLKLAENAVLAQHPPAPPAPFPPYAGVPPQDPGYGTYTGPVPPGSTPPPITTAIVPVDEQDRR